MRRLKQTAKLMLTAALVFVFGNGLGYLGRTWECRNALQTIWVAAPGYDAGAMQLPEKLYRLQVTACTLPEQWGGQREPLHGYP
ncbi:hypothetical protein PPL19_05220 [Pseudomonas psychrotolerans L19]|uniref:hypothetical protein n=1 Tax=Pseudomonas oryzihabitans TaxID=47885 RepID=UPI00023A259B|nr:MULTISPECIES: hypothetical protein [Pseudomonas]EHK72313.1 hypothetical protein PPL19_05220 [Pseudomonas psychrotolerans L19]